MRARALLLLGLVLAALAACIGWIGLRSARATSAYARDVARLESLLAGRSDLQTSVLEARAGLQLSFDDINHAVIAQRAASSEATIVRGHGPAYAHAADELARAAEALRIEETAIETFKTDLALLRMSSRYFPLAADALMRGDTDLPEARIATISALRSDVERFDQAPTRAVARRLETAIAALNSLYRNLGDRGIENADLAVLLGHTHVILDRRERVDRIARALVRSPVRVHLEAARAAYERAARQQVGVVVALRIIANQLAAAGILALAAVAWLTLRQRRVSSPGMAGR